MKELIQKSVALLCALAMVAASIGVQSEVVKASTELTDDAWSDIGLMSVYAGAWGGASVTYEEDLCTDDTTVINVVTGGNQNWAIQAKTSVDNLTVGEYYRVSITVTSTQDSGGILFKNNTDDITYNNFDVTLTADEAMVFEADFEATQESTEFLFDLYQLTDGSTVTFSDLTCVGISEDETTTTTTTTTEAVTDSEGYSELQEVTGGVDLGFWTYYAGVSWANASGTYTGGTTADDPLIIILNSTVTGDYGFQVWTSTYTITTGTTYKYSVTINATEAGTLYFKDDAGNNVTGTEGPWSAYVAVDLEAGDNVLEGTFTATSSTFKFYFTSSAGAPLAAGTYTFSDASVAEVTDDDEETTDESEETTEASSSSDYTDIESGSDSVATGEYQYADASDGLTVINIQKSGSATEYGVYLTAQAAIESVTVNGSDDSSAYYIEGAGVTVYLSALTQNLNYVTITDANGKTYTVTIKNTNVSDDEENTTEAEEDTTVADEETTTTVATSSTEDLPDGEWTDIGLMTVYVGSWGGAAGTYDTGLCSDDTSVFTITSSWGVSGTWAIQAKKTVELTVGETYTVSFTVTSTADSGAIMFKNDTTGDVYDNYTTSLTAGVAATFTTEITAAYSEETFVFDFSGLAAGSTVTITDFSAVAAGAEEDTTAADEETTVAEEDTTAAEEETSVAEEETTAAEEVTTAAAEETTASTETVTTASDDDDDEVTVGKAKVKKAVKKSAKKISIKLKSVANATKYKIQISKKKKFKKKNIILKKNVKKLKVAVKSKKFKKYSKLYVRARAIAVVDGKKYKGAWSKVKKVK